MSGLQTVGDTNNVDYIDWLKLFAASYVHSRGKKEPAPDSPDFQTPVKAEVCGLSCTHVVDESVCSCKTQNRLSQSWYSS